LSRKRRLSPTAAPPLAGAASSAPARIDAVDAARGIAIVVMVAYHFCFDLRVFRLTAADFEHDPFWLGCRWCWPIGPRRTRRTSPADWR
jgi:uncharacterized membrane protein